MSTRRALPMLIACAALATTASSSDAKTSWPSRATPLRSTLGWFKAINAHNRPRLLWYVAPSEQDAMGWASPSRRWAKFTRLSCHRPKTSDGGNQVRITCTFREQGPLSIVGSLDSSWDVHLAHAKNGWRIVNYGQG